MDETSSPANLPESAVATERLLSATPRQVFAAFEDPACLARWWGPDGFTNTFEQFEFQPGGRWNFVMHGPNGTDYANESVFREIFPHSKIVIDHVVNPVFALTITLTPRGADQTHLAWVQEFENLEFAAYMRAQGAPANEQNLDRLAAVLSAAG